MFLCGVLPNHHETPVSSNKKVGNKKLYSFQKLVSVHHATQIHPSYNQTTARKCVATPTPPSPHSRFKKPQLPTKTLIVTDFSIVSSFIRYEAAARVPGHTSDTDRDLKLIYTSPRGLCCGSRHHVTRFAGPKRGTRSRLCLAPSRPTRLQRIQGPMDRGLSNPRQKL